MYMIYTTSIYQSTINFDTISFTGSNLVVNYLSILNIITLNTKVLVETSYTSVNDTIFYEVYIY